MSGVRLKVRVEDDADLEEVVSDMVAISRTLKVDVATKFNGRKLQVCPDDDPAIVLHNFSNKMYLKSNH